MGPSTRSEMTLLAQWVFWRKWGRFGSRLGRRGSSLPPQGCPGLQLVGLGGRQRYLLITAANYTLMNEHAAVVVSVAAAGGFGDGDGGRSKLCKTSMVRPGRPPGQGTVCLRPPCCCLFLISPLSKEESGSCRDPNPAPRGFSLCLPNSLPQRSPWRESGPLAGLPVCRLAAETPVSGSAQNPFPLTPLSDRVVFWRGWFFFPPSPLNFQAAAAPAASSAACLGQRSRAAPAPLNELLMSLQLLMGRAGVPRAGHAAGRDAERGKAAPRRERRRGGSGFGMPGSG